MTSWLYRDVRENYKHVYNAVTDEFLQATYSSLETNLATIIKLKPYTSNNTFVFSSANQYVSGYFAEGRIVNVNNIERSMPSLFNPTVEFSELSFTIANQDAKYSNVFLPGTSNYIPLHNSSVEFILGIPGKDNAFRTLFRGLVKYNDGLSFDKDSITIKATDELANKLSSLPPLETISQQAYPRCAKESVGKLIPLNLGDFVTGFSAVEVGLNQIKIEDNTFYVKAYNVSGGGVIGYFIDYYYSDQSGGVFLFQTGGRWLKTYYPEAISSVYIKRGNTYMRCNFNALPRVVGGHWCVDVLSLHGRNADDTADIEIPYFYQDGDIAIVATRFPIDGSIFSDITDTSPILQAEELLIALARLTSDEISPSFRNYHNYLVQRFSGSIYASTDTITVIVPKRDYDRDDIIGGAFTFQAPRGDNLYNKRRILVFFQDMQGTMLSNREQELSLFISSMNADFIIQATIPSASRTIKADKLANAIAKSLNTVYYNATITQNESSYIITATTQMPQQSLSEAISRLNIPNDISLIFTKGVNNKVLEGISNLKTRISINDGVKDKPIIDIISSLLKCALANIYVDKNLQMNICPLIYEDIANKNTRAIIERYEISYDSINFSSEMFFTTARANYNWLSWMNSASNQTPFYMNVYASDIVGDVRKELDIPYLYTENAVKFVLSRYISYASAGLMVVKFNLPYRYLFLDVGDKIIVTIDTGSVIYENIPMIIRKISINNNLTTCAIEGWFFANYLIPKHNYGNKDKNLSNYDTNIVEV